MASALAHRLIATVHVTVHRVVQKAAGDLAHASWRGRSRSEPRDDEGFGTIEAVILVLGGITIATLLVAALVQLVHSYIGKLK